MTFRLQYRSSADSRTKNACFCFGSSTENDQLFKAGTMIGLNRHGIFDGSWANMTSGAGKKASLDPTETFDVTVTIDLEHSKAILVVGKTRIEQSLPKSLESVTHVGIYAKETSSEFTMPVRTSE
ncbi:hypothetical protein RMSM_01360 [Rhodopirellula maiorica SM1]|uniref:Uncharacterized protein n=1 Tax=Rhodopirellula maiorica SM1 TaxID=1265738 RepID=M5RQY0_9BACT|nr:hypothetical protein RMSM_01360 [Rhodopirellula maiorica SM1]